MNEIVELELVDLAGIESAEAGADPLKQRSQLSLMVGGDQLTSSSTLSLVSRTSRAAGPPHGLKIQLLDRWTQPAVPASAPNRVPCHALLGSVFWRLIEPAG